MPKKKLQLILRDEDGRCYPVQEVKIDVRASKTQTLEEAAAEQIEIKAEYIKLALKRQEYEDKLPKPGMESGCW